MAYPWGHDEARKQDTLDQIAADVRDIKNNSRTIEELRGQLKRHGGHTADCASRKSLNWSTQMGIKRKCDCGWAEIEKRL